MNLCSFVQNELSSIREQLLEEFAPDDMCQIGSQLTEKVCQVDCLSDGFCVELIPVSIGSRFISL